MCGEFGVAEYATKAEGARGYNQVTTVPHIPWAFRHNNHSQGKDEHKDTLER